MIDQIKWWKDRVPGGNLCAEHPDPYCLEASPEAAGRMQQHMVDIRAKQGGDSAVAASLWGRAAQKTAQLALILAASRQTGTCDQRIELCDVDLAIRINNWSTRMLIVRATQDAVENEYHRQVQRLLSKIPTSWITMGQLCHATYKWIDVHARDKILQSLVEARAVERETVIGKTKPTTRLRRREKSPNGKATDGISICSKVDQQLDGGLLYQPISK